MSRTAFAVSIAVHLAAGYALSGHSWTSGLPPPAQSAEFIWLAEMLLPPPREAAAPAVPLEPLPEVREAPPPEREPPPRAAEPDAEPVVVPAPPAAFEEPVEAAEGAAPPIDFEEARLRAAEEVVEQHANERSFMTFSIDDVAPPRPVEEPKPERSIFDPGPGTRGPSVGTVGQARTKFGHRVSELCNALTGGFSLMGFGSFCASGNSEPSGLFPELRPAIMDLMPECVETRPLAAQLGEESPFPTIKCRLVPIPEAPTIPR